MGTITRFVEVHRSVDDVAKAVTDPAVVFPIMGGFGRFEFIAQNSDGSQEWDLYLDVATIHVGGRVLIEPPSKDALVWRAIRGKNHTARIEVSPAEDATVVTMSINVEFAGMFAGWVTTMLAHRILARYMEAGLEQLRHHIEYGG